MGGRWWIVFGCVFWPLQASAGNLSAADIERLLVGHTIAWWVEDSWFQGQLVLEPGGAASVESESPAIVDQGRWRVVGDQLCTIWRQARAGEEKCYGLRQVAERRFVTSGGNVFELREPGA